MLTARGGLAVAELIFYIPALFLSALVALRHGFGRQAGWIYLVLLSLVRVVGSSLNLAAQNHPSTGLVEGAAICQGIGLSPLLLAMLGMLKRVNEGMAPQRGLSPNLFHLLSIPIIAALVVAIIGIDDINSSKPATVDSGEHLAHAAIIIFLVDFLLQVGVTILSFLNIGSVSKGEKRILLAVAIGIPFIFVRLLYSILSYFITSSATFSPFDGNVIVQGLMSVLEEFVAVILFLGAGLLAPKIARSEVQSGQDVRATRRDQKSDYDLTTTRKHEAGIQQQQSGTTQGY